MEYEMIELIKKAQGNDKESMMQILNKFEKLINSYAKKLKYDGADSDLVLCVIDLIKNASVWETNKLKNTDEIIAYITVVIKNQYIKLSKKYSKICSMELLFEEIRGDKFSKDINIDEHIIITNLLEKLPLSQKQILEYLFLMDYEEIEVAKKLNISRQAVNKTKNRALKNLKICLDNKDI